MSAINKVVDVHHVTRVEGHGNIKVSLQNGTIEECRWEVSEAPRFFEAMVLGRKWHELQHITSRICGICSIGHSLASLRATENALGVEISEQTLKLRKILLDGENLQSHILHVGYLALPDLLGVGSVIPLASTHKDELLTVIRAHRVANEICDVLGGRTTHPVTCVVGGFCGLPTTEALIALRGKLGQTLDDLETLAGVLKPLLPKFPDFERETEYIGLYDPDAYPFYEGRIGSTDSGDITPEEYESYLQEYVVPHSTAKYARHARDAYMVGALARFNLNAERLMPKAKAVASLLGLEPICTNPYMNNVAQVVECVHNVEHSIDLLDELLEAGLQEEIVPVEGSHIKPQAGRGIGAVEVPRGLLVHDYTYDESGTCIKANCVIPTNQNHGNIQKDMEALVPTIAGKEQEEIRLILEMLVRAYDPCISCSAHYLDVEFVS